jgi:hypothetical protein
MSLLGTSTTISRRNINIFVFPVSEGAHCNVNICVAQKVHIAMRTYVLPGRCKLQCAPYMGHVLMYLWNASREVTLIIYVYARGAH